MSICSCCGKKYVRKKRKGRTGDIRYIWICPTFSRFGKDYCKSTLIAETELDRLCPDGFDKAISLPDHRLEIRCQGSRVGILNYGLGGRKASWTPEMKEEARRRAMLWQEK